MPGIASPPLTSAQIVGRLTGAATISDGYILQGDGDSTLDAVPPHAEKSSNFTAENHRSYLATATLTVTDPTPSAGAGYDVLVVNGTCTIGGTAYAAGVHVWSTYYSGSWARVVIPSLARANTWSAAQTISSATASDAVDQGALILSAGGLGVAGRINAGQQIRAWTGGGGGTASFLAEHSTSPGVGVKCTGAAADNRMWDFLGNSSGEIVLRAVNDANTGALSVWKAVRSGVSSAYTVLEGSTPGAPSASQVGIGNGWVKAGAGITCGGSITLTSASSRDILRSVSDDLLALYGGAAYNTSGGIILYGGSHATKAGVIEFRGNSYALRGTVNTSGHLVWEDRVQSKKSIFIGSQADIALSTVNVWVNTGLGAISGLVSLRDKTNGTQGVYAVDALPSAVSIVAAAQIEVQHSGSDVQVRFTAGSARDVRIVALAND